MKYAKVIAVIPAYNSAAFVEKSVASLLRQDYPFLRKVVIDDCSRDNTADVLRNHEGDIEVLLNETNCGLAANLNRGVSLAGDEEFLLILEDDVELIDADYVSRALRHFEDSRVGLVCGQATDFSPERLPLADRAYARYLNLDFPAEGVKETDYSLIKADLVRLAALREIGGFDFAGNAKLGAEDQILAHRLRSKDYALIKDATLKYRLSFGRSRGLKGLLKSEANAGKTLGVAVGRGLIQADPSQNPETRAKSNYRRTQVLVVALACISVLLFAVSFMVAFGALAGVLVLDSLNYLRKSRGFPGREKPYFVGVGLANDFAFSFSFYRGFLAGLVGRLRNRDARAH